MQAIYDKAKEMMVDVDAEIEILESAAAWSPVYQYQVNYLKKFKKNLTKSENSVKIAQFNTT